MYELYDKTGKSFLELNREICPDIKKLEKYLSKFGMKPKLTGKGPTMFCEVNNYELAEEIVEHYPDFNGDIFICRPENKAVKILKL